MLSDTNRAGQDSQPAAIPPDEWADRAEELAAWVWDRYVIRTDVWGGYIKLSDRDKECTGEDGKKFKLGKTCTRPRKKARGIVKLTPAVLLKHFRATGAEHVIGIHTTGPDNVSKFGVVEIDAHGEEGNDPEVTGRAGLGWYDKAVRLGFRPLLWDSDGKGGFHLDLLLAEPVPTPNLFWYLREFVRDYATYGLSAQPETFPKQPRVNPDPKGKGHFGNWCRVVGRHHTRDVWANVWNGSEWLSGEAAVAHVLSITGDPASLIPADTEIRCRVREYRSKLPNLGDGQGRDDVAFNFLAWLAKDMALPDADALRYAAEWDADNRPPKGAERLKQILANVHEYGQRAYGSGRNGDGKHADPRTVEVIDVLKRREESLQAEADRFDDKADQPEFTDSGNALEFAKDHGADVRWLASHEWMVWDGKRWKADETLAVVELGKATATRMLAEAGEAFKAANAVLAEMAVVLADAGSPEDEGAFDRAKAELKRAKQALANAKYCRQKRGLEAMLTLARSIPGIASTFDQFDRDPYALNVLNGTIDLRDGALTPHKREDLITRLAPVEFDPKAEAPTWGKYLGGIFGGDMPLICWLQRACGYFATADVREQIIAILYGSGGNGKSVFVETVLDVFGDYAHKANAEMLLATKSDRHETEKAALAGRRFVAACETGEGRRLNEPLVKETTGGDRITARFMRRDHFTFPATFKLALSTNHRPEVRGTDVGIWRRVRLVPFTRRFWKPGEPQGPEELRADPCLRDKLKREYPGILAWIVRGAVEWTENGLGTCKAVEDATGEYRQSEDRVGQFVDERCLRDPAAEAKASDLFAAYVAWAEARNEWPLKQTGFGTRLGEMGFVKRTSNGTWYQGIRLHMGR